MTLNLHHQTLAQFAARLRDRFKAASGVEKGRIATWLYDHYQAGDFTAAQLRAAFGMTTTQFTAFVTRVQTLRTHYLAVQAEVAE
jgi:hypothetical protein